MKLIHRGLQTSKKNSLIVITHFLVIVNLTACRSDCCECDLSIISSISDSQQFTWSGGSKIITLHTTNANVLVSKKVRQAKLENLYSTKKDSHGI